MSNIIEQILKAYCRLFPFDPGKLRLVDLLWPICVSCDSTQRIAQLNCGYQMLCDLDKLLQRQYYFFGTYFTSRQSLADWGHYAKMATTILDVGANAGIFSLEATAINQFAKITAFEPTPQIAEHLLQTCALNSIQNIKVVQQAVGSSTRSIFLNFCGEENEGMNFTTTDPRATNTIAVNQVTLDLYCQKQGIEHIDLLKMDVQGNELDVLIGAQKLLETYSIQTIFFEVNPIKADNNQITCPAATMLRKFGYRFRPAGFPEQPLSEDFEKLLVFNDLVAVR
jgi:FkbM family methyltransferase